MAAKGKVVTGYAKMWPRMLCHEKAFHGEIKRMLGSPGVYVLYRDDVPYYVGKTGRPLWKRIWQHANNPKTRYYNFWNYFSAYAVPKKGYIAEVEGILIASMPTENSAVPRIPRIHIPTKVAKWIHALRTGKAK